MQTQKSPALAGVPGSKKQTRANLNRIRNALRTLAAWIANCFRWAA